MILHTLVTMSEALRQMANGGHTSNPAVLTCFSPYQTEHINRFGEYELSSVQEATPLEPALNITFLEDAMSSLPI